MKTNETLKLPDDKDFLDKIYHFSYHRCNTSFEDEDLCSDIILAVISAIHKQERIENFYAFVWTIARRVYADYDMDFHNLSFDFNNDMGTVIEQIAAELSVFIKTYIPLESFSLFLQRTVQQ